MEREATFEGLLIAANSRSSISGSISWDGGNVRLEWPGDSTFSSYFSLVSAIVPVFVVLVPLKFGFHGRLESGVGLTSSEALLMSIQS